MEPKITRQNQLIIEEIQSLFPHLLKPGLITFIIFISVYLDIQFFSSHLYLNLFRFLVCLYF